MPRRTVHGLWLGVSAVALLGAAVVVALTNPWLLPAVVPGPALALLLAHRGWRASQGLLEEVSAERARLDRLAEEGEHLVARVSQELRGPLTPIRGFATALVRRGDDVAPEVRRRALEQIADRAVRMSRLVDDLLVVTTHGPGGGDEDEPALALGPIDLVGQVRCDLALFRTSHPHRTFEISVAEPIPQALGDPGAVAQVLTALLSNACRYSTSASPVTVHVSSRSAAVQVAVTDRGPGIPTEEHDRIFDRFQRMRRSEDPGGLGLGLYVARRLAEAMGGRLTVDSYEGDGSTFTFSLPVVRPAVDMGSNRMEART